MASHALEIGNSTRQLGLGVGTCCCCFLGTVPVRGHVALCFARMANAERRRFLSKRFVPHGRCAIQRNGRASGMEELTTRICSLHAAVSGSQPDAPHRPKYCTSIFQRLILSIEKKKAKSKPWAAATLCDRLQVVHRNRRSVPLPTQHNRWSKARMTIKHHAIMILYKSHLIIE